MTTSPRPKRTRARTPNNRTTTGFRISDALWAVLEPLLPVPVHTHRFGGGRPRVPACRGADAIFYVLRTGCPWGALQQTELGANSTAHDRLQEWAAADVVLHRWPAGGAQCDELQGRDWHGLSMDGVLTKAPCGGKKTGPNPTERATGGGKRRRVTEGQGIPMGLVLAGANRHAMQRVRATLDRLVVQRPQPTEAQPQGRGLEKGYDSQEGRESLAEFGFTAQMRARGEEAQAIKTIAGQRARRWVVERTQSWMNRFRRILGRWDKKPEHSLAFLHFACALIACRAAGLFG